MKSSITKKKGFNPRLTMTLKDIEIELGVSRKVATNFAKNHLPYKKIGRQYLFSRKKFIELIESEENVVYELNY